MSQELRTNHDVRVHPVFPKGADHSNISSFVRGINYIPEENLMEVRLAKGDGEMPYYYPDVQPRRYEAFINADKYGSYYTSYIKEGGTTRDYGAPTSPEQKEKLEEALQNTTAGIVRRVRQNDPELFKENSDLFESVRRRQHDIKVLNAEDNGQLLKLVFSFRQEIVERALAVVRDKHSDEPEWLAECEELAEDCATTSTTYMVATNL